VPAVFALVVVFGVIWYQWHNRVGLGGPVPAGDIPEVPRHPFDRAQAIKALAALVALLVLFTTDLPREIGGLMIAALLLASRKITSRTMIAAVDWPLLLLFRLSLRHHRRIGANPAWPINSSPRWGIRACCPTIWPY